MSRATVMVLLLVSVLTCKYTNADQCDWFGSGGDASGGVRSVYLRCTQGTVKWHYPRGALRIVFTLASSLRSPKTQVPKHGFRACVKISGPVGVFLETGGKLRQLYSPSDGRHELSHRCFHSQKDMAALFMEADNNYSYASKTKVKLQYELEAISLKGGWSLVPNEEEECRPCSMEELAKAYCQSDLVARGTISAVQQKFDLETAELVLRITKILHQVLQEIENNEIMYPNKHVRIRVPAACDARHGLGEFVVMAKRRLGDLTLVCAPRLEAWAQVVREMDNAPCVLSS